MPTKLKDIPSVLARNYVAGVNTFIRGKPAMGKTETINVFVDKMKARIEGFTCWMFYAPTMSPMDIQASAPDYERGVLRLFNNEALPNAYVTPDAVGVVFFGELPNADPSTTKLLQKYINGEDMSGTLRKPAGVVAVADGNRIEDKSGVQQQARAFMSRWEQLEAYSDAQDNLDFAAKAAWHPTVQTFLKDNPAMIDNYDEVFETTDAARQRSKEARQANGSDRMSEEGKSGVWANMRSWERVSKKEYAADEMKSDIGLDELVGNLGNGVALAFSTHRTMLGNLASFESIIADPVNVKLPAAMDERYALSVMVALKCKPEQMDAVRTFGQRMPHELQTVVLRNIVMRKGFNLGATEAYKMWMADPKLTALLNGR